MAKPIDKSVVKNVALLSRLSLNEKELDIHSKQLASILSYISKLNELNTEKVQPTSHVLTSLKNVFRKDVPRPSLATEAAIENAPAKEGDFFKVPKVVEDK